MRECSENGICIVTITQCFGASFKEHESFFKGVYII